MPEPFTLGGTIATAAPLSGGRRRSHKKLRLVKKKTVRRMLAKAGLKMRGGGPETGASGDAGAGDGATSGGRRRRKSHRKSHRRRRSLFGMKY
jgi:hypothetical protein